MKILSRSLACDSLLHEKSDLSIAASLSHTKTSSDIVSDAIMSASELPSTSVVMKPTTATDKVTKDQVMRMKTLHDVLALLLDDELLNDFFDHGVKMIW